MLIVCPECDTSYQVEIISLGESGRSVRCKRCQTVWFAEPPKAVMVLETAAAADRSPSTNEEPPVRHDEWWSGDDAPESEPQPLAGHEVGEAATGAEEWGIAAGEVPSEVTALADADWSPTERTVIEITTEEAPLVPADDQTDERSHDEQPNDFEATTDVEAVATLGAKLAVAPSPAPKRRRPGLALAATILLTVVGALMTGRAQVVRHVPQTAALYKAVGLPVNVRGLDFKDVHISGENEDSVPMLVVEGTLVNEVNRPVEVPRLRFALLNPAGMETYAWTAMPTRTVLGEGETLAFRSRLASPPPDIRDVQVRFVNRRDRDAGR